MIRSERPLSRSCGHGGRCKGALALLALALLLYTVLEIILYRPQAFDRKDSADAQSLMARYPLAQLIFTSAEGMSANPVPMLWEPEGEQVVLTGHVARQNPAWRQTCMGEALAIFSGPQAYVSPSWYPSKLAHGKAVPTWNYMTVHAHGQLSWIDDRDWVRGLVDRLTQVHESGREHPWALCDAPVDYVETMLGAIVGVRLQVTRLETKFKLSQNRSGEDALKVIEGLRRDGERQPQALEMARAMQALER